MSDWPKYNPERHAYFAPHGSKRVPYCPKTRGGCGQPCSLEHPCRCCETARADAAEAAIQRVREFCEQQEPGVAFTLCGLDYIDGWNDALDIVEQALDGAK